MNLCHIMNNMEKQIITDDPSTEIAYPSSRQLTFDVGKIGRSKHHVQGLLEVDVTEARRMIKQNRRAGTKISFTAWLIKVIADCVALHPPVNAVNRPRGNKVVVFKHVDISIVVEKEVNGKRVPLPYVIRQTERKTLHDIHAEIEAARSQVVDNEGGYVLGKESDPLGMRLFVNLPQWLRLFLMRTFVLNRPEQMQKMMGTVIITTAGMIGHTRGWIVPFGMHPLCLALGTLNEQACVYQGEIQKREILHLTVLIDHDVIDGAPAARFVDDLVRKLEKGVGL
jgi:pyruvate/2-oxoglutarate dehydrogenase complex dihydrolipoamide acyltransferase (E2) component